jgi:hypothetical protein
VRGPAQRHIRASGCDDEMAMRGNDEALVRKKIAHARGRVSSLFSLLDSQLRLPSSKPGWEQQMESYVQRLEVAQAELRRLERQHHGD